MIINGTSRIKEDAGDYVVLEECGFGEFGLKQHQTLQEAVTDATNTPSSAVLKLVRLTVDELGGKPPGDMPF